MEGAAKTVADSHPDKRMGPLLDDASGVDYKTPESKPDDCSSNQGTGTTGELLKRLASE